MTIGRPRLPVLSCEPNCGECCGIAPCTETELAEVVAYARAKGITPINQGMTCPFYQGGGCAVHPVRPRICRAFGNSEHLVCQRGHNGKTDEDALRAWLTNPMPTTTVHEVLVRDGGWEP